jgi:TolA-binding protein
VGLAVVAAASLARRAPSPSETGSERAPPPASPSAASVARPVPAGSPPDWSSARPAPEVAPEAPGALPRPAAVPPAPAVRAPPRRPSPAVRAPAGPTRADLAASRGTAYQQSLAAGVANLGKGAHAAAAADFRRALAARETGEAWFGLGQALAEAGRPEEARDAYRRCLKSDPEGPRAGEALRSLRRLR